MTTNDSQSSPNSAPVRKVRKAVLPAAGLGTRFLPATKAQPKEMLTVVDKPQIQYVAEEGVASGIEHIIIVTGRGKSAVEFGDYRALRFAAGNLRLPRAHQTRRGQRNSAHRWPAHVGARAGTMGLHLRRHFLRRRRQTRLPESHGRTRAAKPRTRRGLSQLFENVEALDASKRPRRPAQTLAQHASAGSRRQ